MVQDQQSRLGMDYPSERSVLQTDLGRKVQRLRIDFRFSQNKILWIQLNAFRCSGRCRVRLRTLDSGPVTVMVYVFLSPLELLGTTGHMPFVTYRYPTSVSFAANTGNNSFDLPARDCGLTIY